MENPNDWTSEKDVSCMYSLSQQDTSRDNRLNMLVESRALRVSPFHGFRLSRRLDVRTAKRALETGELEAIVRYYLDTYYYTLS